MPVCDPMTLLLETTCTSWTIMIVYTNTRPSLQATSRQRVADIFAGQQGMHVGNQPASPAIPATTAKVLAWLAMPLQH
eukprot:COSAG02_NODE_4785_length_4978_cov_33.844002_5_plen_78_part_00